MIHFIDHLPSHVIGIEVTGHVTADEYEKTFAPVMKSFVEQQSSVNYLVSLKTNIGDFDAGVWWDDFKLAIKYFSKWNKIAVVSEQDGVVKVINTLGFAMPGKHKAFGPDKYQDAVEWVSAL